MIRNTCLIRRIYLRHMYSTTATVEKTPASSNNPINVNIPTNQLLKTPAKLEYNFTNDFLSDLAKPKSKSFSKYYTNLITRYSRERLLPQTNLKDMVREVSNSLNVDMDFIIIQERLKIPRLNKPFYIHQQFHLALDQNDYEEMIKLFNEINNPKSLQFKRQEFELFLQKLAAYDPNEHSEETTSKIIKVWENLVFNGDKIHLTRREKLSLFKLYAHQLRNTEEDGFTKLNHYREKLKINTHYETWLIIHQMYPKMIKYIVNEMFKYIGVNRHVLPLIVENIKSQKQLHNVMVIIKRRNIHIDNGLLNIILEKYIQLGMISDCLNIINALLIKFGKDFSYIYMTDDNAKRITKVNEINLMRTNLKFNKLSKRRLICYPILPNATMVRRIFENPKISNELLLKLIINLKINQYPLKYDQINSILQNDKVDFDILRNLLEMVIDDSKEQIIISPYIKSFNKYLNKDNIEFDERSQLISILKSGIDLYEKLDLKNQKKSFENDDELVKLKVRSLLVDLNGILS